jgi:hypothetical protein
MNLQRAMVVFDLTKNPAIVLTANDVFCQMVGYEMVLSPGGSLDLTGRRKKF